LRRAAVRSVGGRTRLQRIPELKRLPLSSYFEGLGTALRSSGVTVGYIRFGFVDTKMAKARIRPLVVSRQVAVGVVLRALRKRQRRVSFPVRMALLVSVLRFFQSVKRLFA